MSAPETTHEVVVVGSGFAGLGQLLALRRAGITDVVLLEQADTLGGTWPTPDRSPRRRTPSDPSPQPEIGAHLARLADDHDLCRHVRVGEEMTGATWDEQDGTWSVRTRGGTTWRARFLVLGTGALHLPRVPALPGAETFAGPAFHSARWDHDVDLRGKRVAVIGSGASAVRSVSEIAGVAAEVQLYRRTPARVLPKDDEPLSPRRRRFVARRPIERLVARHVERSLGDTDLAAVLTPGHSTDGEREPTSDDDHPTLARPDVEVITHGVREIRPGAIVDGHGTEREVDVIVHGPDVHVTDALDRLEITGRGGRTLRQTWAEHGVATHLGMTVSDFPNLFLLLGPDTGLGHDSAVFAVECQTRYVAQAITTVHATGMGGLDVRAEVQQRTNAVQRRRARDAAGVDRTIGPGSTVGYWWRTRRFEPADFELFGRAADAAATPTPQEAAEQSEGADDRSPEAVSPRR